LNELSLPSTGVELENTAKEQMHACCGLAYINAFFLCTD
jgi:hypothetical protein